MITGAERKEARRKAGFPTQQKWADKLGMHKSTVANIECGRYEPKPWYDWLLNLVVEKYASTHKMR